MRGLIVSKFGGSSLATKQCLERVKNIIEDDERRKIIVVSAPGKAHPEDIKVTDMLISLSKNPNDEELFNKIIKRYEDLIDDDDLYAIKQILKERLMQIELRKHPSAFEDSLKAFGEEACARIIAKKFGYRYVDPKEIFVFSKEFGEAEILKESEEMVRKVLVGNERYIVPGFYGYTKDGKIVTLSRGGSDLTAAYIAGALNSYMYENFSDQVGVYSASPHLVEDAYKISEMTYEEIRDLAQFGFNILHQDAMTPIEKKGIPIHIRSTFEYPKKGTLIVRDRIADKKESIVGIGYRNGYCSFDFKKTAQKNKTGFLLKILQVFSMNNVEIEFMHRGSDDVSYMVLDNQLKSLNSVNVILTQLAEATGFDLDDISFQDNIGTVVVSGKGLKGFVGISGKIQDVLASEKINIKAISQGPLERCIIYCVSDNDGPRAVKAIYDKFLRK